MKIKKTVLPTAVLLIALSGCSDSVDQKTVDNNLIRSQHNAQINAKTYANNRLAGYSRIMMDSDSTISTSCRHGDGWASGKVEMKDVNTVRLYCQTAGRGKGFSGCLKEADFIKKSYASQDGNCDKTIKSLPKL